jgi:putative ribosome biogenesis GTPase RsgA
LKGAGVHRVPQMGEGTKPEETQQEDLRKMELPGITPEQEEDLRRRIEAEQRKPLVVVVAGQTGVGKSSLINALFGTQLEVDDVRPRLALASRRPPCRGCEAGGTLADGWSFVRSAGP